MAWDVVSKDTGSLLTAANINQLQLNFSALAAQNSGSPALAVSSMTAVVASMGSVFTQSGFTTIVASIGSIFTQSGFTTVVASAGSIFTQSGFTTSTASIHNVSVSSNFQTSRLNERVSGNGVLTDRFVTNSVGMVIQSKSSILNTQTSGSTGIPQDNTVPQGNEGDAWTSVAFTPLSASSTIRITFFATLSLGSADVLAITISNSNGATDCLAIAADNTAGSNLLENLSAVYEEAAGSTTARTYYMRYGASAGGCFINRASASAYYGGALKSGMIVEEIL